MMKRKLLFLLLIIVISIVTSGCKVKIFEEEEVRTIVRCSKSELENNNMYVKDGTGFYVPYNAEKTFTTSNSENRDNRIIWMKKSEEEFVPTLYKGECLAYVSSSSTPSDITLERFKDCGYSVGIMGFSAVESGQILQYSTSLKNLKSTSDAYEKFSEINASSLTIADIDGKSIDEKDFSYGGFLANMEYGKTYSLGIYVGSFYKEHKVKADTKMLVSDSSISVSDVSLTRNGYYAIHIPDDLESGYYYLQDYGLFRYVSMDKLTAAKEQEVDLNNGLQTAINDVGTDRASDISKEIEITTDCESLTIKTERLNSDSVIQNATVITPEGEQLEMLNNEGEYYYTKEGAVKGKYTIQLHTTAREEEINIVIDFVEKILEEVPQVSDPQQQVASTSNQNGTSTTKSQWVQVMPEPLNETEVTGTQATE